MRRLGGKLTYANVVSTLCLFLLLGGSAAFAATQLPKNSVGSKQLKNNAVTTGKLKNGAVTGAKINLKSLGVVPSATNADHATSADSANTAKSAGSANTANTATNATNAATAATVTGQGTLASGKTEIGIVGGVFQNGPTVSSPLAVTVTFPVLAPMALTDSSIEVAPTASCTGSTANPTAAAGFVCIYPDIVIGASGISGDTGVNGDKKLGFELDWVATSANQESSVRAEWAYTAP
jgi:hypothetical protein